MNNVAAVASCSFSRDPSKNIHSSLSGISEIAARAERKYPLPSIPLLIHSGLTSLTREIDRLSNTSVSFVNSTYLSNYYPSDCNSTYPWFVRIKEELGSNSESV